MKEKRPTILIVDDDESIRDTLEAILARNYSVIKSPDGESALKVIQEREVNIILLDLRLPGMDGLAVLRVVKEKYEDIEVVVITAVKEVDTAVKAMKLGAYHYITKEFDYDEVLSLLRKISETQKRDREILYLRSEMAQAFETNFIVGKSKKMQEVCELVMKVSKLPATVLITGESGTGKQLLARYIHAQSDLAARPFVTLDLAAIPETLVESTLFGHEKGAFTGAYHQHIGKFELAHGGTLFLDEIGHLKYDLQGKLLRAVQDGEVERIGSGKTIKVDVRLIAATNVNLDEAAKKGQFREDLYYRINVIPVKLPSLRERIVDLPELTSFFMEKYGRLFKKDVKGITQSALDVLSHYHWPGNIRELENLVSRLVAVSDAEPISREDIPVEYHLSELQQEHSTEKLLQKACETFERNFILKTLEREQWNRKKTAETLGIPLSTLKFRLRRLNLYETISPRRRRNLPHPD